MMVYLIIYKFFGTFPHNFCLQSKKKLKKDLWDQEQQKEILKNHQAQRKFYGLFFIGYNTFILAFCLKKITNISTQRINKSGAIESPCLQHLYIEKCSDSTPNCKTESANFLSRIFIQVIMFSPKPKYFWTSHRIINHRQTWYFHQYNDP